MKRVLVDADACPVIRIVERISKAHGFPVTLLCDTNHVLYSDYSEVRVIGEGADAVDIALINLCQHGDVVVTQDYGVAALALGKGACAIHQSGRLYTQDNIDQMLMERHLARKARMGKGKHHLKGPKKRTKEEDDAFAAAFDSLLQRLLMEQTDDSKTGNPPAAE
ncbi:MAG: YaiI/YqxD family protein [Clostridia bacterium]|nr:YaiI/YqxD family protein [Clostridia bacterium]